MSSRWKRFLKMLQELRGAEKPLLKSRVITWRVSQVRKMLKPQLHTLEQLQPGPAPWAEAPRKHAVCAVPLSQPCRAPALVGVSWICGAHLEGALFPQITHCSGSLPTFQPGAADHTGQEMLNPLRLLTERLHCREDEKHRLSTYFRSLRQRGSASSAGTPRGLQNFTTDTAFSLIQSHAPERKEASVNSRDRW